MRVDMRVDMRIVATGEHVGRSNPDVPVDRAAGEVVLLFPGATVRAYPRSVWTMELTTEVPAGTEGAPARAVGRYVMAHTPWEELPEKP